MKMEFGLYQQQSMKLMMTNELRQAITMLQYSAIELEAYLKEQQLENPLIELEETRHDEEIERYKIKATRSNDDVRNNVASQIDGDFSPIDQFSQREEGLHEYLLSQIGYMSIDDAMRETVSYIAQSLDENGYLTISVDELKQELTVSGEMIDEALQLIHQLDPGGVGASSLQECLLIQLQQLETRDLLAETIVENHLQDLGNKQFKKIAKKEKVTLEEIQAIFSFIQTLNPKPGALYHHEPASYVVPDVIVDQVGGEYIIILNESHLPKMRINQQYKALSKDHESDVSKYIEKKHEQFQWIQKSIAQRQETILRVTTAIVEVQKEFFEHGATHLQPLTLKMIADKLDIHESTVSRVTTKKYVQTPRGLFELKYFFTSSVGAGKVESGSSSEKVKMYLKQLIIEENKKKPLSDQKLTQLLKEKYDIHVSRRTIAKYREELHIPSSTQRKEFL